MGTADPRTDPQTPTMAAPAPTLTLDQAKTALQEVTAEFDKPENLAKIQKAKEEAGDDVMKNMQIVLPVAMEIQQGVVTKYGFEANQPGVVAFTNAIRAHEL